MDKHESDYTGSNSSAMGYESNPSGLSSDQ